MRGEYAAHFAASVPIQSTGGEKGSRFANDPAANAASIYASHLLHGEGTSLLNSDQALQ